MDIKDATALVEVLRLVAQRQEFAFAGDARPEDTQAPSGEGRLLHASISFSGPFQGSIKMAMPESSCLLMAENILDMEAGQATAEEAKDVVFELLNVLCGQFLTTIEGEKPVFNLSVPELREIDTSQWEALRKEPGCRTVSIEGRPALVCLEL